MRNLTPECLRTHPIINETDSEGKTSIRVAESYVVFMHLLTIGKYPEEIGMLPGGVLRVIRKMNRAGIQFPRGIDNPWGLTPTERRIIHAVDNGANTNREISQAAGLSLESIRVHTSHLREKGVMLKTKRENTKVSL